MTKYRRASLQAAVEAAAERLRRSALPSLSRYSPIPVLVDAIAESIGISFSSDLPADDRRHARLTPRPEGFTLRVKPGSSDARRRLAVAHEIGHTLFFEHGEHQVSWQDNTEREVEERICWRFARALLAPSYYAQSLVSSLELTTPWATVGRLNAAARELEMSLQAVISRCGDVQPENPKRAILVCSKFQVNPRTGDDASLRIETFSSLAQTGEFVQWPPVSAKTIGLLEADLLFHTWKMRIGGTENSTEPAGGQYTLTSEKKLVPATSDTLKWIAEDVEVWSVQGRKWRSYTIPMRTASYLMARKGWTQQQAYVVTLLDSHESTSEARNVAGL